MLGRVRTFGELHKERFPEGSESAKGFAVVREMVEKIEGFTDSRATAKRVSRQEKRVAKAALAARIGAIARSARMLGKSVPGADARFPLPTRQGDVAVLQGGRLFVKEAEPLKDTFIRCGLPATFHDDLQQAVAALENAIAGCDAGKTGLFVWRKAIREAVRRGVDAVGSLDVFVVNTLAHDTMLVDEWKKGRRVEYFGRPTAVSSSSETATVSAETTAPVTPVADVGEGEVRKAS